MNKSVTNFLCALPNAIAHELPVLLSLRDTRVEKEDGSYVTQGDIRAQSCVLRVVEQFLPGAVIVSEEMSEPVTPRAQDTVVVIDPIDGTENFTSGLPEWGVSVAVYFGGRHIGSTIGCPELGIWLRTGVPLPNRYTSRIRALSSSLTKEQIIASTTGFEYRILGCCVYNMLNVVRGSFYSFENPKGANSWDILAGLNLALEHGLNVNIEGNTYAGEYLPPGRKYRFKIEQR